MTVKRITVKKGVMSGIFAGYFILVIGVILSRGGAIYGYNFNFLSAYKNAWNNFDVRTWQQLIFNILMFVPLGIILPITHKKFHKITYTFSLGLGITICVEFIKFIMKQGIFDLADVFNYMLGILVGYSIVMTLLIIKKGQRHKYKKALIYFSPFLIVVASFVGILTYYNLKEFGNLSENYDFKLNMKQAIITTELNLSLEEKVVPIYKAPTLNKNSAQKFAIDFYENINIDTSNIRIVDNNEGAYYWANGDKGSKSYSIWLDYLDGSYIYTDWTMSDEGFFPVNAPIDVIIDKLGKFNISIPREAEIKSEEVGNYTFTVNNKTSDGNIWINGVLLCSYYNDDTIKSITNDFVVYEKVKDVDVISEMEAYENILDGKFAFKLNNVEIKTIEVKDISTEYRLDSKGYYQPVYIFNSIINNVPHSIIIPALS